MPPKRARLLIQILLLGFSGAAGFASCGVLLPTDCTSELGVQIRPAEWAIRVGQEFTPTATGTSCGGRQRFPYSVTWSSSDPAIATVVAGSGRVVALSVGTVRILAHDVDGGPGVLGEVRVTVTP